MMRILRDEQSTQIIPACTWCIYRDGDLCTNIQSPVYQTIIGRLLRWLGRPQEPLGCEPVCGGRLTCTAARISYPARVLE